MYEVAIIGAGPTGLFAVFQAGMLKMKCAVIDALPEVGGQCSALYAEKPIYDIPAYPKILAGELIEQLKQQAAPFKPEYYLGQKAVSIENHKTHFKVHLSSGRAVEAKIVLIAAGHGSFVHNAPPISGIEQYEGSSILYSVADKNIFAGKRVVVAGGGDSAADWAIELSQIAAKVSIVHRRNKFRCAPSSEQKLLQLFSEGVVDIITPYQLSGIEGSGGTLSRVIVADLKGKEKAIKADFLLPFFGLKTDLGAISSWGLELCPNARGIEVDIASCQTSTIGIYAIGDVAHYEGKLKLILTGFAEAATALHHSYPRVFDGKKLHFQHSTTTGAVSL